MAVMLAKTYAALKSAGVDDDRAQAAAEELASSFDSCFASMDGGISRMDGKMSAIEGRMTGIEAKMSAIESKFTVLLWAVGVNAAATIAILGVLLRHG